MYRLGKVISRFDCYYAAVDAYHDHCFNVGRNDYALRYVLVREVFWFMRYDIMRDIIILIVLLERKMYV